MKIKYRQKKPKILEEMLKKATMENYVKNLPKEPEKIDIKKCTKCNRFYKEKEIKSVLRLCPNCFNFLPNS